MESEQLLEEVRRFVEANGLSIPHALLTDMDELMGYDTAILASCGVPTIDAARFVAKVKGLRARQQNPPPAAAPAPLTPKSPTESFKKGDAVEFQGLASAKGAALNGHRSTVSEVMASSGRVLVGPFWVEGKVEYKSVPPANLRLLDKESSSSSSSSSSSAAAGEGDEKTSDPSTSTMTSTSVGTGTGALFNGGLGLPERLSASDGYRPHSAHTMASSPSPSVRSLATQL